MPSAQNSDYRRALMLGTPGAGKTTLGLQFLRRGVELGEKGLYITLAETQGELLTIAQSHGWSLDGVDIFQLGTEEGLSPDSEQSILHPSEVELGETTRGIMAAAERVKPARVVFDSLSEMRLLAQNPLRYRRQVLALKNFFATRNCTVMLLDDRSASHDDLQLHSIAHGVISLDQYVNAYGPERRRIRVIKMRGIPFRGGEHDCALVTGGLQVFPRLVTSEHRGKYDGELVSAGSPELDRLLGGGLARGSNMLFTGPSGAGKSTFARLVAGYTHPTAGSVTFEGHNIHAEYASLRSRIGMVPQDDVVHGQLTVKQALMYAAELRLPPDTTKADREQVVNEVLEELEMTKHLDTRVDKLSGGQRKRASVALELLTGPSLLILDEPTSGLDPALDRQVMTMLRQLADAGRVVLVVTHSLTYLDVCDQVLLLAPGGKTAFYGPPSQIGSSMGTTNWADIFSSVAGDPDAAHRRYLERSAPTPPAPPSEKPGDLGKPAKTSLVRQFSTIARRQFRLTISDRGYFIFLALLPFIMGTLALTVPGDVGFGLPVPAIKGGEAPNEPGQILVLLNVGAIFMGTALTIRALIGERAIFLREQAVGLSTSAYLLAKVAIFTIFALVQSAIAVTIAILGKGWGEGAVASGLLLPRSLELYVDVAATTVCAAMVGLALSALAKSNEQIMPLLVIAIMSQLVFSGGMIPVTGRIVLDQMSWATPARWGFAATASTIDLTGLVPAPLSPDDSHWKHTAGTWWFDMGMLVALSVFYVGFVRWKIRLKAG
jgi:ABC-type multidrug transport system ATPase subunit